MNGKGWLAFGSLAVVGVAGALTTVLVRQPDDAFLFRQNAFGTVRASRLGEVLRKADEPVPGPRTRAVAVRCRAFGRGELRNPWSCRARYASGRAFVYGVRVNPDGSFRGADDTGEHVVSGCCVTDTE